MCETHRAQSIWHARYLGTRNGIYWIPTVGVERVTWVDDATSRFLEGRRERSAASRTLEAYGEDLDVFAGWYQRQRGTAVNELRDVTPLALAEYREWLASRCKPATVNRRLSTLRSMFAWAAAEGHLAQTPAGHLRPMAQVTLGPRALIRDTVARLVDATGRNNTRDAVLITVLAQTGLRISEALALTWRNVQVSKEAGMLVVERGKGSKYREVPLNATARRALLICACQARRGPVW
jgi:site-specific recombinase XerD